MTGWVLGGRDVLEEPAEAFAVREESGLRVVGERVTDHRIVAVRVAREQPDGQAEQRHQGKAEAEGRHGRSAYARTVSIRVEPSAVAPVAETVPPAFTPPPGSPRFPLIDGLRAIAALAIVATHTAALSGFNEANPVGAWTARMDSGVAIFFVLSGFLLYRPWVGARLEGRPGPRPLTYLKRRALRILPAYWVALTILGLVVSAQVPLVFSDKWWVYYGLLQSWSSTTILGGIGVAWSLSVELAFYVLLPVLAFLSGRWLQGRRPERQVRAELWALALSALAALVVRTAVIASRETTVYGNTLPGMWAWFAGGMALAILSAAYGQTPVAGRPRLVRSATELPLLWWGVAFTALTITAWGLALPRNLLTPYTTFNLQAEHLLYGVMAVALVTPAVFADGRRSAVARVLSWRLVGWLGLVSYGIFLFHLPLAVQLIRVSDAFPGGYLGYAAAAVGAATACAALSYYLVEKPFLRLKGRRR